MKPEYKEDPESTARRFLTIELGKMLKVYPSQPGAWKSDTWALGKTIEFCMLNDWTTEEQLKRYQEEIVTTFQSLATLFSNKIIGNWLHDKWILDATDKDIIQSAVLTATEQWWDSSRDEALALSDQVDDREASIAVLKMAQTGEGLLKKWGLVQYGQEGVEPDCGH